MIANLHVREVVASYPTVLGRRVAVHNASFDVRHGEVAAIVGPNGAGKSTLLSVVTGFHRPDRGICLIGGIDPVRWRRSRGIACLPQIATLPEGWSVRHFLGRAADLSCPPAERAEALQRAIERAALEAETLQAIGSACSPGTRRRIVFAAALMGDPAFIVADEPFAGLDPAARVRLRHQLRAAVDGGATLLIASHDLRAVAELANRVWIMARGQLRPARGAERGNGVRASDLEEELLAERLSS